VVALALVFCVAIVLSNVSLRIIPVSFNQVTAAPGSVRTGFDYSCLHSAA